MSVSTVAAMQLAFEIPTQPFVTDTYGLMPEKVRTKRCSKCKEHKPRAEFSYFTNPKTMHRQKYSECKQCRMNHHYEWAKGIGREKTSVWRKKKYAANPDVQIIRMVNLRARKLGVKGQLTVQQWEEIKGLYGNACAYCGLSSLSLHIDHLWPLSLAKKNLDGGEFATNDADNIIPACVWCNEAKQDRPFILMLGWKYGLLQ